MRALWCFFNPSMVTDFASIEWSEGRLPELLDIRSPSVHSGMARIAREVLAPSLASHAMVEGTIPVLLSDLCRGFSPRQPDGGPSRLTSRQPRAITEGLARERPDTPMENLQPVCGLHPAPL